MFRSYYISALNDYKIARRRAAIEELLSRITGTEEQNALLSYDEVRRQLQAVEKSPQHLQEIALDAIIGSVGRYHDFTRKYLPKSSINQKRWARVMATAQDLTGLPPIDVYQIGDTYFVKDGNHRVSVARQMGNSTIQAYVTEVESKVGLSPDITPDDLIIKAEQVKFLEQTGLDQLRPGSNLSTTTAGAYPRLLDHIAVHRHYMGLEQQREIPFREAAAQWYDQVFLPVVSLIYKRDLLKDFPDRTPADLYLWTAEHRAVLEDSLGWEVGPEAAIADLTEKHGSKKNPIRHWTRKLIQKILPDLLESGPPPGSWRERLASKTVLQYLFNNLIVALDDSENAANALEMAIQISNLEHSRIHGIHIHPQDDKLDSRAHDLVENSYRARCQDANISEFNFKISSGEVGTVLCEQSRFADLIVLPLNYPPGQKPIQRLSSGMINIIRNCPVPILTVPTRPTGLQSIILAFDGSLKAREALYLAAYFGSQHNSHITVLTSSVGCPNPSQILQEAKTYLSQFPADCEYLLSGDPVSATITSLTAAGQTDLVMIGGYGGSFLLDVVLGSVVDQVLRNNQLPILICR